MPKTFWIENVEDEADIYVGQIYAYRTWRVHDFPILGSTSTKYTWRKGINISECLFKYRHDKEQLEALSPFMFSMDLVLELTTHNPNTIFENKIRVKEKLYIDLIDPATRCIPQHLQYMQPANPGTKDYQTNKTLVSSWIADQFVRFAQLLMGTEFYPPLHSNELILAFCMYMNKEYSINTTRYKPYEDCSCGFYGVKPQNFDYIKHGGGAVVGIIRLSGLIIEGTKGYRAEKAEVAAFFNTPYAGRLRSTHVTAMKELAQYWEVPVIPYYKLRYNAPLHQLTKQYNI